MTDSLERAVRAASVITEASEILHPDLLKSGSEALLQIERMLQFAFLGVPPVDALFCVASDMLHRAHQECDGAEGRVFLVRNFEKLINFVGANYTRGDNVEFYSAVNLTAVLFVNDGDDVDQVFDLTPTVLKMMSLLDGLGNVVLGTDAAMLIPEFPKLQALHKKSGPRTPGA